MPPAPLPLAALLQPDHVRVPLAARTLADAVLQLVGALAATGAVRDPDRLRERVEEARAEDLVGLADRAFILHYRDESIRELVMALGVTAEPLRRALDDAESQAARIVAVVVAPPRLVARHLQVVRTLTRSLARPAAVDAVLAADTPEAVCAAAALQATVPAQLTVRDLMTERPRTVGPDTSLRSAVLDMRRAG
ncbi:MAG: PTS sugar transporter subunit IIA, partial [Gemmatimonadaceae bacterium]